MRLRALLVLLALALTGCATTSSTSRLDTFAGVPDAGPAAELRLGYSATLPHATPLHGVASGTYQEALGDTRLRAQVFPAGPAAVEALFAGSVDAAYLGPGPAVNAFVRSAGAAVRIVAGAASGGAALVVADDVASAEDLRDRVLATPQTGGTQDIALRTWLDGQGLGVDRTGAGEVTVRAQENAQTLQEFQAGRIAGAWVPEPWASRLVLEGGGRVLVDEADLWPGGRFVTTHLVVRTEFLRAHPETVRDLLRGQVAAHAALDADPARARAVVDGALAELTGKALAPATLDRAFAGIELTEDPLAPTLRTSAEHAFATGLVDEADLTGIYDLALLREVLGRDVDDAGLSDPTADSTAAPKGERS